MNAAPRINLITLGVDDVARSRRFYEALGWRASSRSQTDFTIFLPPSGGVALALFPRRSLAEDATVSAEGGGFRGVTLAANVAEKADVQPALERAAAAGGRIVKPAQDVFWGGHCGYYADPDGHLWEVAWNPSWPQRPDGSLANPE